MNFRFLLPCIPKAPFGGVRVVYRYASELAVRGHHVEVVHPAQVMPASVKDRILAHVLRLAVVSRLSPRPPTFPLDRRVRARYIASLDRLHPTSDMIDVATSWETAEVLGRIRPTGPAMYLVQGLEDWNSSIERTRATWRLPFRRIVISEWLKRILEEAGVESVKIPNGVDTDLFRRLRPQSDRRTDVLMMYHPLAIKGSTQGLEAIARLRSARPGLRVALFGGFPAPADLPPEVEYHRLPAPDRLVELYNDARVFIAPSLSEGWGLTALEAMSCGCSVVATDIGGHREFCTAENSVLVPPDDAPAIASAVAGLLDAPAMRDEMSRRATAIAASYSWENSVTLFERCASGLLRSSGATGPVIPGSPDGSS